MVALTLTIVEARERVVSCQISFQGTVLFYDFLRYFETSHVLLRRMCQSCMTYQVLCKS
jgi:hypothetical protein